MTRAARDARRALQGMARPAGELDASRYFRGTVDLDRLERYLRAEGPAIPRTTVRYASNDFQTTSGRRC